MTLTRRSAIVAAVLALVVWAWFAWFTSTLNDLPATGDPAQWWSCTTQAVNTDTPPACLTERN